MGDPNIGQRHTFLDIKRPHNFIVTTEYQRKVFLAAATNTSSFMHNKIRHVLSHILEIMKRVFKSRNTDVDLANLGSRDKKIAMAVAQKSKLTMTLVSYVSFKLNYHSGY